MQTIVLGAISLAILGGTLLMTNSDNLLARGGKGSSQDSSRSVKDRDDVRREDRREDRQEDRRADRREDRREDRRADRQEDRREDRRADRREDRRQEKENELRKEEREREDENKNEDEATAHTAKITRNQAISIASQVLSGRVKRVEKESEDGRLVFKVRIISNDGRMRADVRIDANTGEIIRQKIKNRR